MPPMQKKFPTRKSSIENSSSEEESTKKKVSLSSGEEESTEEKTSKKKVSPSKKVLEDSSSEEESTEEKTPPPKKAVSSTKKKAVSSSEEFPKKKTIPKKKPTGTSSSTEEDIPKKKILFKKKASSSTEEVIIKGTKPLRKKKSSSFEEKSSTEASSSEEKSSSEEEKFIEGPVNFVYLIGDPGDKVQRKVLLLGDVHEPKTSCKSKSKTSVADFCRHIAELASPRVIDLFIEAYYDTGHGIFSSVQEEKAGRYLDNLKFSFRNCLTRDKSSCTESMRVHYIDPRFNVAPNSEVLSHALLVQMVICVYESNFEGLRAVEQFDIRWPKTSEKEYAVNLALREARLTDDKFQSLESKIRGKYQKVVIDPLKENLSAFYKSSNNRDLFKKVKLIAKQMVKTGKPASDKQLDFAISLNLILLKLGIPLLDAYFIYRLLKRATNREPDLPNLALEEGEPITHVLGYVGISHTITIRDVLIKLEFRVVDHFNDDMAESFARFKTPKREVVQCLSYETLKESVTNFCQKKKLAKSSFEEGLMEKKSTKFSSFSEEEKLPLKRSLPLKREPSRLVTETFVPFKTNEYLTSTDLVKFLVTLPASLRNRKLVPKGTEIFLPSTVSEATLRRLATVPGIEALDLYVPEDIELLAGFTDLKKLTLHQGSIQLFSFDFLTSLTKLYTFFLDGTMLTEEEINLLPTNLKDLTLIVDYKTTLPKNLSNLTQLTGLKIKTRPKNLVVLTEVLKKLTNLTSLYIDVFSFGTTGQMVLLAQHTNLIELGIIGSIALQSTDLAQIGKLTNLTKLDLSRCHIILSDGIDNLVSLTQLKELNLSFTATSNSSLDAIATLSELNVLKLVATGITTLEPLSRLKKLTHLDVVECEALVDFTGLDKLTSLTSFLAYGTQSTTDVISQVYKFPMTELMLDNVNAGIAPLRGKKPFLEQLAAMKNLTRLKLGALEPSNEEVKVISSLINLRWLNLAVNFDTPNCYDDDGLAYLSNLTNLTDLDVYGNSNLTSKGMANCLPHLKSLIRLSVSGCMSLNANFFRILLQLPNLQFVNADDAGDNKTFVEDNELYLAFRKARPNVVIRGVGEAEENQARDAVRRQVIKAKKKKMVTMRVKES